MKLGLKLLIFSFILSFKLDAQIYDWIGKLHGFHRISMTLEKKGTLVVGHLYAANNTFELEGSWNDNKIDLLEFHDGLWTAKIKLEKDGDLWSGYWIPRTESEPFLIQMHGITAGIQYFIITVPKYRWHEPEEELDYVCFSPVSGLNYFGHLLTEKDMEPDYFYYNTLPEKTVMGLETGDLKKKVIGCMEYKSSNPILSWPLDIYRDANYHSLIEILTPVTSAPKVDSVLKQWKDNFIKRLKFQRIDLQLTQDESDWEKNRWYWNAHAYVEVYAMTDKCWSMALHTKDLKGQTEVESLHYFPHKEKLFFLKTEFRNWDKFKEVMFKDEKDWDEWIFHPHGIVAIKSFSERHGIERRFLEDKDIKKYYRFFSPLK